MRTSGDIFRELNVAKCEIWLSSPLWNSLPFSQDLRQLLIPDSERAEFVDASS